MAESTIWWLLAGVLVAAELLTGTFYLLMVSIGLVAAAIAAHLGVPIVWQLVSAASISGGAVVVWYVAKKNRAGRPSSNSDRNVHLDVGETVLIDSWNADGTTSVKYRGAQWTAMHRPGISPSTGLHRVSELVGNRLLVDPV